ncbi:energy transducer TonB [Vibrio sp. T187]|uniref:energy transducer TonB n=1 Tax=Vibrio TaxID=662 RepID=UPI0010C9FC5F|nr:MULTISPECIES: energy transducer TonB [Vibrio]MBW3695534.1 energy transducer TonB [Vibrio sp. T187]
MNVPRYVIAGGASIALHAALLFVAQESKVFAMPAGSQSTSVSINFVSSAPSTMAAPASAQEVTPPEPITKEAPPVETPQPAEPPKPAKVVKSAPVVKKTEVTPKPKKPEVKKTTPRKPQPVVKKTVPKKTPPKVKPPKPVDPTPEKITEQKARDAQKSAPPEVVNQGASDTPVLVNKPSFAAKPSPPRYPRMARKRGIQGVATYEIWLDENGKQTKQALVSSSGALMLDKAALDAIKKWKFSAHTVNGRAIAHRIQIPVRFKLD